MMVIAFPLVGKEGAWARALDTAPIASPDSAARPATRKRGKRRTSSSLEPYGSKASAGTLPHSKLRSMKGFILVGRADRDRNLGFRSSERKLPGWLFKDIPGSDR